MSLTDSFFRPLPVLFLVTFTLTSSAPVDRIFLNSGLTFSIVKTGYKVSEYDQEIPQSHTADQPTAMRGIATEN